MENMASSTIRKSIWQRMLPWLAFGIALAFLVWPAILFGINWRVRMEYLESTEPGFDANFGEPTVVAKSEHFKILSYENYISTTVAEAFLEKAEIQRVVLMEFLMFPEDDQVVHIVFLPECDYSYGGANFWLTIRTCNDRSLTFASYTVMHEFTHSLIRQRFTTDISPFFVEGLAVMAGERFGWGALRFYPDNSMVEYLQAGELFPLSELRTIYWSIDKYGQALTSQRYAESGSFAKYLVAEYGIEAYLDVYKQNGNFEEIYHQSLDQLEQDWLQSVCWGNLKLALLLVAGALLELVLFTLAIFRGWKWLPAALVGWLSVFLWSFFIGTSYALDLLYVILYRPESFPLSSAPQSAFHPIWLPAGLLLAFLFGLLISRWNKSAGKVALWLVGSGTLVGSVFWPAVRLFFV